jgi:multiple sugar transport system permease protein
MSKKRIEKSAVLGIAFVMPALIFMVVFIGYPTIQNILLSLKNVDVFNFARPEIQEYVGFDNYRELLTGADSILLKAVGNTLVFTIASIFFQFIIGFGLALFFNQKFPGCKFFRGIVMISWILPVTVVGLLFKFMFAATGGIVNQFLMFIGIIRRPVEWLLNGGTAMAAIVTANIWIGIPFNMILILTGLTTIPAEIYESANIDGAGKLRQLFAITVPMIKPAIMSVLTLGFVYTFKVFDLAWVMTKGGPVNATQLVSTYAYRLSFEELLFSRGAASANVLFIILLVMGFFYIRTIDDSEVM